MNLFNTATALMGIAIAAVTAVPTATSTCTYTATPCAPVNGPTLTITVYEQPFTQTATQSYDCHGCGEVTVSSKNCFGHGIPIQTTTFVFENAQRTTTVPVCSATPN